MLPVVCAEEDKMRLQILCIVTVITAGVVTGNFCGAGWFSYKHFCYKNDTKEVSYWDARKKCQDMGADLTTMSDVYETAALEKSFQTTTGKIDLWIGLYNPEAVTVDSNSSGFRWTDGTSFNSSYDIWFGSGEKKEPNKNDQFARFYRADNSSQVKWAAAGPSETKGFICKKETWDPTSEHCLEDICYKISASAYDNENDARKECVKNNMAVLKHGQFPESLNQTYPLDGSTPFWLDNGNRLERQGGTPAWVICTGPSEKACPCGWHGLDKFCYYLGGSKKNKNESMQECKENGRNLAKINSHTENKFIKSIVNASQSYWIRNDKNAKYCYKNDNFCHENTVIQGTWKHAIEAEANYFICKKKRKDLIFHFCLDGYPGECYNSSQIRVPPRNLNGASCASGMQILSEQMVKDRNISRNLAKAIYSPNVSCNQYLIKSDSGPKVLYAKNNAEIELKYGSSDNNSYHYICVKDINECSSLPCKYNGTCMDRYHNFQCKCLPGYTGKQCETDIDDCQSSQCENGGTCVDGYQNFQCNCLPGYTGKQCETEVDECVPQPCKHGSTCKDEVNGYNCECSSGYTGQNCEKGNFCGAGWFSYKQFCFKNDTREVGYWVARKKCQDIGADLTTMSDAEETAALERSFQTTTGKIDLWIGLYRPEAVGHDMNISGFKWTDGTSFNSLYGIWFGSEPGLWDQYARFYRANDSSPVTWAAAGETARKGSICKKETWGPTSEHCLEDICYKISASAYDKEHKARQECFKNNMTVLKHGQFPDTLNQTYPLDGSTPFWLDYGNQLERQGGTWAWVICTGPSEEACPCGWQGLDKFCYYLGVSEKNKNDATQECKQNGAVLAMINSHTENQFIRSIVNASQGYWIGNGGNADYCYQNKNYCPANTFIQETGKLASETDAKYYICKKKRKDLISHFDFCLDGYSGECYNSSKICVPPRNLNGTSCASGMEILSEKMVNDRGISTNLAKAISSANVSCNQYLIKSDSGPKLLNAKNDAEIELNDGSSDINSYQYICVKDIDECSTSPCENGGACVDGYQNFQCNCLPGFTGKQCETEVNECMSQPCKHGSTCKDEVNGYNCLCSPGYTGKNCETEPGNTGALAAGVVVTTLVAILIIGLFIYWRKKKHILGDKFNGVLPLVEKPKGNFASETRKSMTSDKVIGASSVFSIKKLKELGQRLILDSNKETLIAEFESIPMEEDYDMSIGKDPTNKPKNRFKNIIPYNHNRVILHDAQSDYINASFVNTSRREKEFLASQGPKPETLPDFWKMIWDNDVTVIIMLTNLTEGGKRKCEQYWPDARNEQTYGDITTKTTKEQILPSYTYRRIKAWKQDEEVHTIWHYHFRVWPDHGVPHTAMGLLNFRNKVKANMTSSKGPILVHCSAGVGRTGTFIGLDLLVDEAEEMQRINIQSCVASLRKERGHMVQNKDQYVFLYKAMVQWSTLEQTIIPCYQFEETYSSFSSSTNKQLSQIDLQFKCLKDINVEYSSDEMESALSEENKTKNRNVNILPRSNFRVFLLTVPTSSNGYINAIFLDGYQRLNAFMATQAPLPETKADFWHMVQDYKCSAIVMLCPQTMLGKDEIYTPDSQGQQLSIDRIVIMNEESQQEGDILIRDLLVCRQGKTRKVRHFSLAQKMDNQNAPAICTALHSLVERWQQQAGQEKIVIHCMDGAQWTGIYCAATCLFDQINLEQEVDVFEMAHKLKICRANFFTSQRQYELLYVIVQHYLRQFQTYANFQ